jgi:hypothetical protein
VKRRNKNTNQIVIQVFLVIEGIESLEHELEEGLQVFRRGGRDEDVRITAGRLSEEFIQSEQRQ